MKIKLSGYLVKPAKQEQLAYELNNLRYAYHIGIIVWTFSQLCGIVGVTKEREVT